MNDISENSIHGRLDRLPNFPSQFTAARNVDIWLPPAYSEAPERLFPVLYMHDGQNLFFPGIAMTNIDWGVDECVIRLGQAGKILPPIVVGVWNGERRWLDYIPQKPLEAPDGAEQKRIALEKYGLYEDGKISSDRYLKFLVSELKPYIDSHYRSLPGRDSTFVMGSSMGGLASLNALCEYPGVFGGTGCLSTHWTALDNLASNWVLTSLPPAGVHKIYFDFGTEGLDAEYEPFQKQIDQVMRQKGYTQGVDWVTQKFPGADHNEAAWRQRLDIPLKFLLPAAR